MRCDSAVVTRSRLYTLLVVLCALCLAACSRAERREAPAGRASAASEPAPAGVAGAPATAVDTTPSASLGHDVAHIVTVDLVFTVANVDDASRTLRDALARVDGYVSNMSGGGLEPRERRATFELKVPAARVAEFRGAIAGIGEVTQEEERVEDVGEERADRKARLANARAEEKRLLDLLAQRTGSLADVLTAERELARVRETIERYDAQAAALETKIAFATVHVTLAPRVVTFTQQPVSRLGEAAREGIRTAGAFLLGIGVVAATAGPTLFCLAAILAMVAFALRAVIRRVKFSRA